MSQHDIDKAYISSCDYFLHDFDKQNTQTDSQLKEILKHQRIALLRDNAAQVTDIEPIWEGF